jgi:murein DD-endopeptidase MepM/ murein hydrolase activator NlpD
MTEILPQSSTPNIDDNQPSDGHNQDVGDFLSEPVVGMQAHASTDSANRIEILWENIAHTGLLEPAIRIGTHGSLVVLVLIVVWSLRAFYFVDLEAASMQNEGSALTAPLLTPTATMSAPTLPEYSLPESAQVSGVQRVIQPYTIIPSRPRVNVTTHTVQTGDSVFGIAATYGLKPETILWSNYNVLGDNPHSLQPGQVLNILPVDGTYHKWSAGENLQKVADYYKVDPLEIIEWPGNPFDVYAANVEDPGIQPGTMLIIPNGQREMIDYGPPRIPRDNPAVARTFGPGHCGELMDGAIGGGTFIWPTADRFITGYDYSPSTNHWGIDIDGDLGSAVWSIDNGVIVYSGWSYNGYGNLVVVDHGNGWQSLYAHLNDIDVSCGESVFQGTYLGGIGNTGNSSGPHLHFELIFGSAKVNPWDFLQ